MIKRGSLMLIFDQFDIIQNLQTRDVPYSPNQFLALDFFAVSYSNTALVVVHSIP